MPKHTHDCEKCKFLGSYHDPRDITYDMYYCPNEPTIIARWSSNGPDYTSGLTFSTMSGNILKVTAAIKEYVDLST